jgi:hypothetical protein
MLLKSTLIASIVLAALISGGSLFAATDSTSSLTRLQAAATSQNVALSDSQKSLLKETCKTAQANLRLLRQKEPRTYESYSETYFDIQNEISALEIRLNRQGVVVKGIDRTFLNYKERIDQYERLNDLYQRSLDDVAAVDCAANPNEFYAGVAVVRQLRAQLLVATQGIKEYIYNDVRSQFNQVKLQLKV